MTGSALVDGKPASTVDLQDRGLQFGDGVFETMRLRNGRPLLWQLHWDRLQRGLHALRITSPAEEDCLKDLKSVAPHGECIGKLVVTRGSSPRGYAIPCSVPSRRMVWSGPPMPEEKGGGNASLRVGICQSPIHPSPLPGTKHLNRIENVLARMEWKADWEEGLLHAPGRGLVSGTASNLFLIDGETLITPPVSRFGIAGTRRRWLLECAHLVGIPVREEYIRIQRLRAIGSCWLTSTVLGIRSAQLVGTKNPGPETVGPIGYWLEQFARDLRETET